jgi:hypothetical protein
MSISDEDDLFSSLARELLADLQVDDGEAGWLNLDQLEHELARLDASSGPATSRLASFTNAAPVSAASEVLAHTPNMPQYEVASGVDAWSISLQRFTASSLEQDFLSADAARKTTTSLPPPGMDFSNAQDYNTTEMPQMQLQPPGISADPSHQLLNEAAGKLVQQVRDGGVRSNAREESAPPSSEASMAIPTQGSMEMMDLPPPGSFPKTPQNSTFIDAFIAPTPPPTAQPTPSLQKKVITPPDQLPEANHATFSHPPVMAVPIAVPIPSTGMSAWQTTPLQHQHIHQQQQQQHQNYLQRQAAMPRIFCNPHPNAPPIPAQHLVSKYMNARDILFVVHSLMKPLLAAAVDNDKDYQLQLLMRLSGQRNHSARKHLNGSSDSKPDLLQELASRQKKTQEWSSEKHVLGHIPKANALRPRSLIAPFVAATSAENDSSNKQRASLWKARIYCDQAYQAYAAVLECWRTATPGQVPSAVQVHLQKLLKCFGMLSATEIDPAALTLLLKLRKGRVLVSRVLEQALVPPATVQTLLPVMLHILTASPPPKDDPLTDDRLSLALARVIASLPDLTGDALVESARMVIQNGPVALSSESRMHCVHALLQRGSTSNTDEWNQVETDFMALLGGM